MKPILVKVMAAVGVLAGLGVLAIEIQRFREGRSIEIWLWGLIGLFAALLGLWELFGPKSKDDSDGGQG